MPVNQNSESYTQYYPFGMVTPGRSFSAGDGYRFGFNGQEQVNEVLGNGKINTAFFWEYDSRLGRRWNLDPKGDPASSGYMCFTGNPIYIVDVNGDTTTVYSLRGKALKVIPDNLENQVHYIDVASELGIWLKHWPQVLKGDQDAINNWSKEIRTKSRAYIGPKTIESASGIPTEGNERGGILVIGEDRQLLLVDKTDELAKLGYASSSNTFPMGQINSVISDDEKKKVFGTWHSHPGNYPVPTNYRDPSWLYVGNSNYMEPDDYWGYLFHDGSTSISGGHPALLITKDYLVTYGTAVIKHALGESGVQDNTQSEEVFGVYKKFKKSDLE